jgi:hypothetical protein
MKHKPPATSFVSKIKRPSMFGRKYSEARQYPISQTISTIDTAMNNLPKRKVSTKTEISTTELLPFIPQTEPR